ncbi:MULTISPECIES: protein-export chaperone SecB [Prevotella]|jgi:preprotein translocase subunit secB|uniref:protein-export chaperone SecB n=1 Tax=Prevotella TaxID=838 RepID=UPI0011B24EC0|nr:MULTISPECIES: protein-export chaperone SecB [Prevotella]QUB78200.1 protein-export chaperone SecB [Prevotella jejuni]
MNKKVEKARFRFVEYLFKETSIKLTGEDISDDVEFGIEPNGIFEEDNKMFILTLNVLVKDKKSSLEVKMTVTGKFEYETNDIQELVPYLGFNAPAIMFPYIRAYITNITALGGMSPIILPTLNMESVGKELLDKISSNEGFTTNK